MASQVDRSKWTTLTLLSTLSVNLTGTRAPPVVRRAPSEALGQLGQDEPASGMALEPLVAFAPISGSVAIALHHRN